MRKLMCILAFYTLLAGHESVAQSLDDTTLPHRGCDTNLKPTDPSSKFVQALQCLHRENNRLRGRMDSVEEMLAETKSTADQALAAAQSAEAAARKAMAAADEVNAKLDRMFKKRSAIPDLR